VQGARCRRKCNGKHHGRSGRSRSLICSAVGGLNETNGVFSFWAGGQTCPTRCATPLARGIACSRSSRHSPATLFASTLPFSLDPQFLLPQRYHGPSHRNHHRRMLRHWPGTDKTPTCSAMARLHGRYQCASRVSREHHLRAHRYLLMVRTSSAL
jgi:hypothetical protein